MWTLKLSKQANEFYESLLETLDILETEPDILKKLKKAEAEIAKGKFKVWTAKKH